MVAFLFLSNITTYKVYVYIPEKEGFFPNLGLTGNLSTENQFEITTRIFLFSFIWFDKRSSLILESKPYLLKTRFRSDYLSIKISPFTPRGKETVGGFPFHIDAADVLIYL